MTSSAEIFKFFIWKPFFTRFQYKISQNGKFKIKSIFSQTFKLTKTDFELKNYFIILFKTYY